MCCIFFVPSNKCTYTPSLRDMVLKSKFGLPSMMFLAYMVVKGNHLECIVPVLLCCQLSTVESSCMVPSVLWTWSYPWAFWRFALVLVHAHLLPMCEVWVALDLLLSSLIICRHDTHLTINPSCCAGWLWILASSGSLSCLDCGISWLLCSSPYRWLW